MTLSEKISVCKHPSQQYWLAQLIILGLFHVLNQGSSQAEMSLHKAEERKAVQSCIHFPDWDFHSGLQNHLEVCLALQYPVTCICASQASCLHQKVNYVGGVEVFKHTRLLS